MSSVAQTATKYTVLGLFVVGVGYWAFKKFGGAVANVVTTDLNPASDQNLANRAVNAGVQALTGTDDTLGTELANIFQPTAQQDGFAPTVTLPSAGTPPTN